MDEQNNAEESKEFRADGYKNLLNKYGTSQDNSTAYEWASENFADDMELTKLYEGNGLFTKIIDRPSEEAVKHGLDIEWPDEETSEYIEDELDRLEFEDRFTTAEKWARLYGGAIIVMITDDGKPLEEPLDFRHFKRIIELRVFERSIVQADISQLGYFNFRDSLEGKTVYDEPEYYDVFSTLGTFRVHRSRCLVFRNGRVPQQTTNSLYRYWGIPEYVKIKRALRECITTHEYGTKMLERSVQAIYKMKNLANLLSTDDGENKVLQRLQVIDMARGILNSIAIDNEGEDYNFISGSMAGVSEIINSTCNMLSAVTEIPQTILFGRSPSGMNSTGESDFENYYNMVENIQKQNMKKNVKRLLKLIVRQGFLDSELPDEIPFKVKFAALWSPSEAEKNQQDATKANTMKVKADIANAYIQAGVLDPQEVRSALAKEGDFEIEEILPDDGMDISPEDLDLGGVSQTLSNSLAAAIQGAGQPATDDADTPMQSISDTIAKNVAKVSEDHTAHDETTLADTILSAIEDCKTQKDSGQPESDVDAVSNSLMKALQHASRFDSDTDQGVGVIVVKDGKILVGDRSDHYGLCGPGGHIENGEDAVSAAFRETAEEFRITPKTIVPVGYTQATKGCLPSTIYLCTDYEGSPIADGDEMHNARWMSVGELNGHELFPSFAESINLLIKVLTETSECSNIDGAPIGNDNAAKDHKSSNTESDDAEARKEYESRLAAGDIKTQIDTKKQNKHIKDSKAYLQALVAGEHPSMLTLPEDARQAFVAKALKDGHYIKRLDGSIRVSYKSDKAIGIWISKDGKIKRNTGACSIHLSNTGSHIVPEQP